MQNLMNIMDCCEMLGVVNPATTYRYIKRGVWPKPIKIGGLSRWLKAECEAALEKMVGLAMADGKITKAEIKAITDAHAEIVKAERGTLEYALKAGALLQKAKDSLEHGQWRPWLSDNCPDISDRIASKYMRLASEKNQAKIKSAASPLPTTHVNISAFA